MRHSQKTCYNLFFLQDLFLSTYSTVIALQTTSYWLCLICMNSCISHLGAFQLVSQPLEWKVIGCEFNCWDRITQDAQFVLLFKRSRYYYWILGSSSVKEYLIKAIFIIYLAKSDGGMRNEEQRYVKCFQISFLRQNLFLIALISLVEPLYWLGSRSHHFICCVTIIHFNPFIVFR